jgi:hypothetical protein
MENKHVQSIPTEIPAQALQRIDEANTLLAPYLLPLTPQERHELPKMGDKSLSFFHLKHGIFPCLSKKMLSLRCQINENSIKY